LKIGPIEFANISAIIIPDPGNDALLGMNILNKFEISQKEDVLILTYKKKTN